MKLNTRLFGPIEYDEKDIIHFSNGLPSFEDEKSFLILPFAESDENLLCLQSTKTSALSFILLNPFSLNPSYAPHLKQEELDALKSNRDQDLCFYVLCAMKRPVSDSTVNMKCPIAINPDDHLGIQVILEDEQFHMRHVLSEFNLDKEDQIC